jgi:hypothetical protein
MPQSAGTMWESNLNKEQGKKKFFGFFFPFLVDGCHTKSVVESHESTVLRQLELRRDKSEASGEEKRESDHLSKFWKSSGLLLVSN